MGLSGLWKKKENLMVTVDVLQHETINKQVCDNTN